MAVVHTHLNALRPRGGDAKADRDFPEARNDDPGRRRPARGEVGEIGAANAGLGPGERITQDFQERPA